MPHGGELLISYERFEYEKQPNSQNDKKETIKICVKDTGHGISAGSLNRVFQPFFTTKPAGSGLGLSIVKDILDQHNAIIRVESDEGNGTEFIIIFPVIRNH